MNIAAAPSERPLGHGIANALKHLLDITCAQNGSVRPAKSGEHMGHAAVCALRQLAFPILLEIAQRE